MRTLLPNRLGGLRRLAGVLAVTALCAAPATNAFAAANIVIINLDGAGEGFNDATPAAPIGGNSGTTIGQQRLICFQRAAQIWSAILTSTVTIQVQAAFNPLTCTATTATLGSAGPRFVEVGTPGLEFPNYWYHEALASKLAGTDLTVAGDPGLPPGDNGSDINAQFNSNLGQAGCLTGVGWYYGLDHNEGTQIDLLAVLEHEFAHGFGFSTTTASSNGAYFNGLPALWDRFLLDETNGLHWDQNTAAQRQASAISNGNLTWDGQQTTYQAAFSLSHQPELVVPFGSGLLAANGASFGGALTIGGLTAQAILAVDGTAPANDACEPITNGVALTGKIAVIDRGTCTFTSKVSNAQAHGAAGVILVNNVAGGFSPSGTDPSITIPVLAVSQADGVALKSAIAGGPTTVTMRLSPTQVAGLHPSGRVRMYSPNPLQPGSSVSHFDVSAIPNLLMEPAINPDLSDNVDLTSALFRDIGWLPRLLGVPPGGPASGVALASAPNPARGSADIQFQLAADERVELTIYDVSGRTVRSLAKGTYPAGSNSVHWDGLDASGHPVSPGIYLARLKGPRTQATRNLVWMN